MNILFYYPDKERAISLSSLMIAFRQQGHNVFLLTHAEEGDLHNDVRDSGVHLYTHKIPKSDAFGFYIGHAKFLTGFIKKYNIEIVYSHIQRANLIAVIAQMFSSARFILCRHHSDCAYVDNNFNERMVDRIINFLGREFIVPSDKVFDQMTKIEGVKSDKIHLIRYAYDFETYPKQNAAEIKSIRQTYSASLLLVKIARLIPEKRHMLLLMAVHKMIAAGLDIKLLLLSDGVERRALQDYINQNNLNNHIFLIGYKTNVVDYIAASDLVVHVSETEASSNLAKEVGLQKRPILVCDDVGDFNEYLKNNVNSVVIKKYPSVDELEEVLRGIYNKTISLDKLGDELYHTVMNRFSVQNILPEYDKLNVTNRK